jgi:hypothetical protein
MQAETYTRLGHRVPQGVIILCLRNKILEQDFTFETKIIFLPHADKLPLFYKKILNQESVS